MVNKLYESYKQSPQLDDSYDVIIIGSGLSGLTTASLLAERGKKVLILEKHYTPGGFTHIFKRNDYEWDVGVHYIGEMHKSSSIIARLFNHISDGQLKFADMGEVYDVIVIGGKRFEIRKGVTQLKADLKIAFPTEHQAIDAYFEAVMQATLAGKNFFTEKVLPDWIRLFTGKKLRKDYLDFSRITTRQFLEKYTKNEMLIAVLTGQYGDYGLPPAKSSFAMHAALVKHYFNGGYYPIGGSGQFFETIAPKILHHGGKIIINAAVDEILIENNAAIGVKLSDGRIIHAKQVVSSAGVHITYHKLLRKQAHLKDELKPSHGHFCLYVGLEGNPDELQLPKANYWIYPDEYHDDNYNAFVANPLGDKLAGVYISFPAAKDPSWKERYPGKSTIDILTIAPYEFFKQWEGTKWKKRGEEYDTIKEQIAQKLLEQLYSVEPQLRGKVAYYELSTPLTTKNFCSYLQGELYGLDHTPERFDNKSLKPKTAYKNLFLTGQDIVTVGIGGALFSGILTASAMLKKNILKEILS
jgi:all-trans-retinol 13,14-reductase